MVAKPLGHLQRQGLGVFLDRDGVLNKPIFKSGRSYAPTSLDQFALYPDAFDATTRLKKAGYKIAVVTNQPDVGNGVTEKEVVQSMHDQLYQTLPIDHIECCFETRSNPKNHLKPKPDMLFAAAKKLNLQTAHCTMIGDRATDIEAGQKAGCRSTVFIDHGYTSDTSPDGQTYTTSSLSGAVDWLLNQPYHH